MVEKRLLRFCKSLSNYHIDVFEHLKYFENEINILQENKERERDIV